MNRLVAILAAGVFLGPFNSTMLVLGLRPIADHFGTSFAGVSWLIIIYLIILAATQPLAGKMGDIYGRKLLFILGLCLPMLAAVLAPLAPSLPALVLVRALQALGVALIMPNAMAIVKGAIPSESNRNKALSVVGTVWAAGATLGPPAGGIIVDHFGWQFMFLINLPICLPLVFLALRHIPGGSPERKERLDVPGALLFSGSLAAFAVAVSLWGTVPDFISAGLLGLSLAAFLLFMHWEGRTDQPILHPSMFRNKTLSIAIFMAFLMNFFLYDLALVVPVFLDRILGLRPTVIGILLTVVYGVFSLVQPAGGYLTTKYGKGLPMVAGSLTLALGFAGLALVGPGVSLFHLALTLSVCGLGLGLGNVAIQNAALESAPARMAGLVSGLYSLARHLGSILASSLLALVTKNLSEVEVFYLILAVTALFSATCGLLLNVRPRPRASRDGSKAPG